MKPFAGVCHGVLASKSRRVTRGIGDQERPVFTESAVYHFHLEEHRTAERKCAEGPSTEDRDVLNMALPLNNCACGSRFCKSPSDAGREKWLAMG